MTAPSPIQFSATNRKGLIGKFTDRYGASCSIQESSYQDEECIWLGVEIDPMGEVLTQGRMHITRELACKLAEILLYFSAEGTLGLYDAEEYQVGRWVLGIGKDNHGIIGRVVEVCPGAVLKIQDTQVNEPKDWECTWSLVPTRWIPTEAPPRARSLFEHLED